MWELKVEAEIGNVAVMTEEDSTSSAPIGLVLERWDFVDPQRRQVWSELA